MVDISTAEGLFTGLFTSCCNKGLRQDKELTTHDETTQKPDQAVCNGRNIVKLKQLREFMRRANDNEGRTLVYFSHSKSFMSFAAV